MPIDLAVVPVAGLGTRLLPVAKSQPKEMLAVGRKPVVQHVVEELVRARVRRILFITGPGKESIQNHFDSNAELIAMLRESGREELLAELDFERTDVAYFYTRQRRPLGVGHAVAKARPMVGEQPFVIALGDTLIGTGDDSDIVGRLTRTYERHGADAVVAFEPVPADQTDQYGIATVRPVRPPSLPEDVFELDDLVEKPPAGAAASDLAVASRYVCRPVLFDYLDRTPPDEAGLLQLTDALRAMIHDGRRVLGVRLAPGERRYDVGDFASYFTAFVEFALADPKHGRQLADHLRRRLAAQEPEAPAGNPAAGAG